MSSYLRVREGWHVADAPLQDCIDLVVAFHYSKSASKQGVYRHGLYSPDGYLVGAALWIPPLVSPARSVRPDGRVLCLSRLVVLPFVPTNGASFLLGRSMRMIDPDRWPSLLTYADTRLGHTGSIYRATNWEDVGQVPSRSGAVWVHSVTGEQRGQQRGPKWVPASEMVRMGYVRQPALPKIKFVYHFKRPS